MSSKLGITIKQPITLKIQKVSPADMLKAIYDPRNIQADVFNMDNMSDGSARKAMTAAERTKLAGIATGAQVNTVNTVQGRQGDVVITKTDLSLQNVPNVDATQRANHTGTQTASTISDFAAAADARINIQKAAANGLATLGSDSKIPTAQLPALAIADTFVVASQAAMLALTAQRGDVAIRTDNSTTYILAADDPTTLANWKAILVPAAPVQSVNGYTGNVVLSTSDIAEGSNKYYTDARVAANSTVLARVVVAGDIGGTPSAPTIIATHLAAALPVNQGGSGTTTQFTQGSMIFAGASGVYSQDNSNNYWDSTNKRLGIRTALPTHALNIGQSGTFAMDLVTPTGVSATAASGGSLPAGTYYFVIVAADNNGTTIGSSEVSATVNGTTTNRVTLSWTAVPGAYNYRIYKGGASGGQNLYFNTSNLNGLVAPPTTYNYDTDTGANNGTVPTVNSAYVTRLSHNSNSWISGGQVGIGRVPTGSNYRLQVAGAIQTVAETIGGRFVQYADNDAHSLESTGNGWWRSRIQWTSGQGWIYNTGTLDSTNAGSPGEAYRVDGKGNFGLRTGGNNPSYGWDQYGGQFRIRMIATPGTPTVTVSGTPGSTSYSYMVIAKDSNGNRSLASGVRTITNGPDVLNGTNFNTITWAAVNGAVGYDVLKTDTLTLLGSVASNSATPTTLLDTGQSTSVYVPPTRNSTADMYVDGNLTVPSLTVTTNPGTGKVLVSDNSGNGSWSTLTNFIVVVGLTTGDFPVSSYANATAAIQAALDAVAAAGGGTVFVKAGVYVLTGNGVSKRQTDNIALIGEGTGLTVFRAGSGGTTFNTNATMVEFGKATGPTVYKNILVQGITFDRNSSLGAWGLICSWVQRLKVKDCEFINPSTTGHSALIVGKFDGASAAFEARDIVLENLYVDEGDVTASWESITVDYAYNVVVLNSYFKNKKGAAATLLSYGSERMQVIGCYFEKSQLSFGGRGPYMVQATTFQNANLFLWGGHNLTVSGCSFGNFAATELANYSTGIKIQGMYITDPAGTGETPFFVPSVPYPWECRNIVIVGNVFDNTAAFAIASGRIDENGGSVISAHDMRIVGNTFRNSNWDGVFTVARKLDISHNYFVDNNTDAGDSAAAHITVAAEFATISDNTFEDNIGKISRDIGIQADTYSDLMPNQYYSIHDNRFAAPKPWRFLVSNSFTDTTPSNVTIDAHNNPGLNPGNIINLGTITSNPTFNRKAARGYQLTLGGNISPTVTGGFVVGEEMLLLISQDATGGRTVTWPANVKFTGGTASAVNSAANAITHYRMIFDGTNYQISSGLSKAQLDATYEPVVTPGTTAQYYRGDKTWQTLNKAAVGLSAVDNTADVDKPVSTAQAAADALKLAKASNLSDLASASTARTNLGVAIGSNVEAWSAQLDTIAGLTPANDDILQRKAGAWTNRTVAQYKTDLALTKADVGLSNVPNVDATQRANHTGTQTASTISDFSTAADARITAQKAVASGLATLDTGGKIPSSQLPAIAISDTFVVASQAAMLALTAQTGDVAIRTDTSSTYILQGSDPTVLANWVVLATPAAPVSSVNGKTGSVTLTTTDIAEGTSLYYTTARQNADFDTRLGTKTTDALAEGTTNKYYTSARANSDFDTRLATKTTANLAEGSNLYYTTTRANTDFDTRLATKSTSNLTEGSNLYYTSARVAAETSVTNKMPLAGGNFTGNVGFGVASPNFAIDMAAGKVFGIHMPAPSGLTAVTVAGAGGANLVAGTTYYYKVDSTDANGNSLPTAAVTATPDATNGQVSLSWTAVPGTYATNIYRGTTAANVGYIGTVFNTAVTYTDTGSSAPGSSPSTGDNAYSIKFNPTGNSWILGGQTLVLGRGAPSSAALSIAASLGISATASGTNNVVFQDNDTHTWEGNGSGWHRWGLGWQSGQGWMYYSGSMGTTRGEAYRVDGYGNFSIRNTGNGAYGWDQYGGQWRLRAIASANAPTVTPIGTAGSTSYSYYVVAKDSKGNKTLASSVGSTSTGNATLSGTNYNQITWSAVAGAVGYDILKANTNTLLGSVTPSSATPLQFNDTGQSTSAYTPATRNTTADSITDGWAKFGGTAAPTSTVEVAGSFATAPTSTQTGNYTVLATDNFIPFNIGAAATATLPDATTCNGREIEIILISTGFTLTIATVSSQTINGAATQAITTQYKYIRVKSVGGNWLIMANN